MHASVSNRVPNPQRTLTRFSISLARCPPQSLSTFTIFFIDALPFDGSPGQLPILTPDSCPKNIRVLGRLQPKSGDRRDCHEFPAPFAGNSLAAPSVPGSPTSPPPLSPKTSLRVPLPRRVKLYVDASQASPKLRSIPVPAGGNLLGRDAMLRISRRGPAGHGSARNPLRTPRR